MKITMACPYCKKKIKREIPDSEQKVIRTGIAFCNKGCGLTYAFQYDHPIMRTGKITWEKDPL